MFRICNASLCVGSATVCDEAHYRTWLGLLKYLYPRLLAVIPLPTHFKLALAALSSHIFDNTRHGVTIDDSKVSEFHFRGVFCAFSLDPVVANRCKLIAVGAV